MLLLRMHKTTDEGLEPIETCNSGDKAAVLKKKKPLVRSENHKDL